MPKRERSEDDDVSLSNSQSSTFGRIKNVKKFLSEETMVDIFLDTDSDNNSDFDCSTTDVSQEECEESDQEISFSQSTSPWFKSGTSMIIWHPVRPIAPSISFIGNPGLLTSMPSEEPIDFFRLLANDKLFDLILCETNIQGRKLLQSSTYRKSRIKSFKEITKRDLEIFLGLIFLSANIRAPSFAHYWKKNDLYDFPSFSNAMPRDRFHNIMCALYFSKNPETEQSKLSDPLYKIRPLLDHFNNTMREIYYPRKNLSLHEPMSLWKNSLYFHQYIKKKSHKFRLKFYMLTEPNGLVLRNLIYCGSRDPVIGGIGHIEKVLKMLLTDFLGKGHSVFFDKYYTSISLVRELLYNNTYSTGALRSNRKNNPLDVIRKKVKKDEVEARYTPEGICILKWHDKRDIIMISSEYKPDLINLKIKNGKEVQKPEMVDKYNDCMNGIDHADQFLTYYPCEKKTIRWYVKVALHIFHIIMNNAYLLHRQNARQKMTFLKFREAVIDELIYKNKPRLHAIYKPMGNNVHLPAISGQGGEKKTRKRCKICYAKGVRKEGLFYCPMCPDKPGLCLDKCFAEYHNYT